LINAVNLHRQVNSAWPSLHGYQPKGGDALQLESKAGMVCVWVLD